MTGGVWIASYILLWVAVIVLGVSVAVLLRQIGVLHTRVAPMGVHFAGEGPEKDEPAPDAGQFSYAENKLTLVAFTSPTCELCEQLVPGLHRIERAYDEIGLRTVSSDGNPQVFASFNVRSTPYLVAVDRGGVVRSRGVANTIDQAEEMLAEALQPQSPDSTLPDSTVPDSAAGSGS